MVPMSFTGMELTLLKNYVLYSVDTGLDRKAQKLVIAMKLRYSYNSNVSLSLSLLS